jgi:hypothetical protein
MANRAKSHEQKIFFAEQLPMMKSLIAYFSLSFFFFLSEDFFPDFAFFDGSSSRTILLQRLHLTSFAIKKVYSSSDG